MIEVKCRTAIQAQKPFQLKTWCRQLKLNWMKAKNKKNQNWNQKKANPTQAIEAQRPSELKVGGHQLKLDAIASLIQFLKAFFLSTKPGNTWVLPEILHSCCIQWYPPPCEACLFTQPNATVSQQSQLNSTQCNTMQLNATQRIPMSPDALVSHVPQL